MGGRFFWIVMAVMAGGLVVLVVTHDSGSVLGIASDDFAGALYLGILGAVIGAGLLGSGIGFGRATRSIAMWLAILLVLVGGYQYRYELQDVASRLSAGLIPGSPLSMIDDDGRAAVMLERLSNGHFEVRAEINGSPVTLMIDTGATSTVLTDADARRAGYDTDAIAYDVPIMTANGRAFAARFTADAVSVGGISRRDVPILVAESGRLGRSLLGMDFIGSLSGFDMRGERLILRD